jgi:hypothetical protein
MTAAEAASAVDDRVEIGERIIAAVLTHPELLDAVPDLEIDDFAADFAGKRHRAVWEAIRNLREPIGIDAIHEHLAAKDRVRDSVFRLHAGRDYLEALVKADSTPDAARTADRVRAWALLLRRMRECAEPPPAPKKWRACRDLVPEILSRKDEPWVSLRLADEELVSVRLGGIVLLVGGAKRGKTSLAACLLLEHARDHGPAISMSLELPADEWTARAIGGRCDASWPAVLRGEVDQKRMLQVLPERLVIVEREHATIATLEAAIEDMKATYPAQPILAAVDYVQLVAADSDDDIRPRIGRTMRQLDRVARDRRIAMIALAQGSRASSRALANGAVGAETIDAGAETADLERWASAVVTIGKLAPPADDGTCAAELSIAAQRMGRGDEVRPARFAGASGLWRFAGDARPASEVKAERDQDRTAAKVNAAALAIAKGAEQAAAPMTREELGDLADVRKEVWRPAIQQLIAKGDLVEVERKRQRSRAWLLWTRARAEAAGIPIVSDREVQS